MTFDPKQFASDLAGLYEAVADLESDPVLRKGANSHASTKATHHDALATHYAKIADHHAKMADHYKDGAKGAHKDDAKKVDEMDDDDGKEAVKAAGSALEAITGRPSKRGETVTRGELSDLFAKNNEGLLKALVQILTPPAEGEFGDAGDKEDPALSQGSAGKARKAVVTNPDAPDKDKTKGAELEKTQADSELEIQLLRDRAAYGERMDASPEEKIAARDARTRLAAMARDEVRKAIRQPRLASSGEMAGFRGVKAGNL